MRTFKDIQFHTLIPNSDTTLHTDSSTRGLGAVILQHGNPIYFASRALSNAEKKCQNLERKTLGTIWGMEMIPLLSLWNTFHPGNRSEIAGFYLQKTHGPYFTTASEAHLRKLLISTL